MQLIFHMPLLLDTATGYSGPGAVTSGKTVVAATGPVAAAAQHAAAQHAAAQHAAAAAQHAAAQDVVRPEYRLV